MQTNYRIFSIVLYLLLSNHFSSVAQTEELKKLEVDSCSQKNESADTKLNKESKTTNTWQKIDDTINQAIREKKCPGAVLWVVHQDKIIYQQAYGMGALQPKPAKMNLDAIFDLASLTKPLATSPAIWKLIEQKRLRLEDPIAQYWPEFAANGKAKITIADCLLHRSGLTADNPLSDYQEGKEKALETIAKLKLESEPGSTFKYSDVGYIVLGRIVEKISGESLAVFTQKQFYKPLQMNDTMFLPTASVKDRCLPTTKIKGHWLIGEVHDPRAQMMGGIAGHAGLFSTAHDIARFGQMILHEGELGGIRVFQKETVQKMLSPQKIGNNIRNYGWDIDTAYASQRGTNFEKGKGFGHTGFTGTSIWIDQPSKTIVILLTHRVHPDEKGGVVPLRREIGTLVAQAIYEKK